MALYTLRIKDTKAATGAVIFMYEYVHFRY